MGRKLLCPMAKRLFTFILIFSTVVASVFTEAFAFRYSCFNTQKGTNKQKESFQWKTTFSDVLDCDLPLTMCYQQRIDSDSAGSRNEKNLDENSDDYMLPQPQDLPSPHNTSKDQIRALFALFDNALATGNPKLVTKRYARDAVLLPTANGQAIMDEQSIHDFYANYLSEHQPRKKVIDGRIRIGHGWAEDAGICEISTFVTQPPISTSSSFLPSSRSMVNTKKTTVQARYSFVYVWEKTQWKILHHHTSALENHEKESLLSEEQKRRNESEMKVMTTERMHNLFRLFQDAWEVGDSQLVARWFQKDAFLLPINMYSDINGIQGIDEIQKYYEEFLLDEPVISQVDRLQTTIDKALPQKWAKDIGTLQIAFQNDKSTVNARYSIDYILDDDGVWRISHLILSPLPQDFNQIRMFRKLPSFDSNSTTPSSAAIASYTTEDINNVSKISRPPAVTKEDVRSWFEGWNAALVTGDPLAVLYRYAPDAVMISTASGIPKTTQREIQTFYQIFLWNRPHARVLSSHVTLSTHWCKDVGVLEYTMNGGRQCIRERFSFLYIYNETSGWKIAHHHSSAFIGDMSDETRQDWNNLHFQ